MGGGRVEQEKAEADRSFLKPNPPEAVSAAASAAFLCSASPIAGSASVFPLRLSSRALRYPGGAGLKRFLFLLPEKRRRN